MTKDLPKVLDVPVLTDHGRMRDRLDALERLWTAASTQLWKLAAKHGAYDDIAEQGARAPAGERQIL